MASANTNHESGFRSLLLNTLVEAFIEVFH